MTPMTDIAMPRLSDSMEEGTILRWLIADGEHVARGQELVEIETDKATMTYESDATASCRSSSPRARRVAVGAPIARRRGASAGRAVDPRARRGRGPGGLDRRFR